MGLAVTETSKLCPKCRGNGVVPIDGGVALCERCSGRGATFNEPSVDAVVSVAQVARVVRERTLRELLGVVEDVIANKSIPVDREADVIRAYIERTLE